MKKKHLRYDIITAHLSNGEHRHPQEAMKALGITYQHSTPQSISDQWWFWNCENIPDNLPEFITDLTVDPIKCGGFGLSEEMAKETVKQKNES